MNSLIDNYKIDYSKQSVVVSIKINIHFNVVWMETSNWANVCCVTWLIIWRMFDNISSSKSRIFNGTKIDEFFKFKYWNFTNCFNIQLVLNSLLADMKSMEVTLNYHVNGTINGFLQNLGTLEKICINIRHEKRTIDIQQNKAANWQNHV